MYSSGPISWFLAFEIWLWIPRGREALGVDAEILEAGSDDAHLVGLVVDREARRVAEPLRLAAQHPPAGGVEGEDPGGARLPAEHPLEPLAHLAGRLVRERDREDLVRLRAVRADQVGDPMGQHAGLARAGSGDDEQRAVDVQDGFALGRIQAGEEIIVRCDGHASDASGAPQRGSRWPRTDRRAGGALSGVEHDDAVVVARQDRARA